MLNMMTTKEVQDLVARLIKKYGNVSIFKNLKITSKPVIFDNGKQHSMVQLKAVQTTGFYFTTGYPNEMKFVIATNPFGKELPERFKVNNFIDVIAVAKPYKARVYGKLGKPIKYPDGTQRFTTKTQFIIKKIGVNNTINL